MLGQKKRRDEPPRVLVQTLSARYCLDAAETCCVEAYAPLWFPLVRAVRQSYGGGG